jgi:hypothetical protein
MTAGGARLESITTFAAASPLSLRDRKRAYHGRRRGPGPPSPRPSSLGDAWRAVRYLHAGIANMRRRRAVQSARATLGTGHLHRWRTCTAPPPASLCPHAGGWRFWSRAVLAASLPRHAGGDHDLHQGPRGHQIGLYGGAGGFGRRKVAGVDFIEGGKILGGAQPAGGTDHVVE